MIKKDKLIKELENMESKRALDSAQMMTEMNNKIDQITQDNDK